VGPQRSQKPERPHVSIAHLPAPEIVQKLVYDSHCRNKRITDGQDSQVDSGLAGVPATCSACTRGEMTVKQIGEEQSRPFVSDRLAVESDLGSRFLLSR
jgi:hypothetical protein